MALPFTIQVFKNLQNVNAQNMNLFYQGKDMEIFDFFPLQPSIMSGIGNTNNNYNQIGTTNQFNFTDGALRFADQPNPLSGSVSYATAAVFSTAGIQTIALGVSPGTQYVTAKLTFTVLDAFKVQTSCVILNTTMSLAEIAAQTNPLLYMPLFVLTLTLGNYIVSVDVDSAWNYAGNELHYISQDASSSTNPIALLGDFLNQSLTSDNGWQILPGGFIIQWLEVLVPTNTTIQPTLPIAFPNNCITSMGCLQRGIVAGQTYTIGTDPANNSSIFATLVTTGSGSRGCRFWAIGF